MLNTYAESNQLSRIGVLTSPGNVQCLRSLNAIQMEQSPTCRDMRLLRTYSQFPRDISLCVSKNIVYASSVLAEIWALKTRLDLASHMNIKCFKIETDCKIVFQIVYRNTAWTSAHRDLIQAIHDGFQRFQHVTYISEKLMCADVLAACSVSSLFFSELFVQVPCFLTPLLYTDVCTSPRVRSTAMDITCKIPLFWIKLLFWLKKKILLRDFKKKFI